MYQSTGPCVARTHGPETSVSCSSFPPVPLPRHAFTTRLHPTPSRSALSWCRYDEKTDIYSLGMLLFEMCHPPFGTKMERMVVLTKAHRLIFPPGDVWGPPKGQEAIKSLCWGMLQRKSSSRPSAAEIVRQVLE